MNVREIADKIPYLSFGERAFIKVNKVSELESDEPNTLTWCSYENSDKLQYVKGKIIIIDSRINTKTLNHFNDYIICYVPRQSFMEALKLFDTNKPTKGIRCTAEVNADSIGKNVNIGHNVIVEEGVEIYDNVTIGHNTVILKGTIIYDNVTIGCNCTIGGVGFGYEKNDQGVYEQIPHLGGVMIKQGVEIGNNTCIDRAVMGHTYIGSNTKIDNLVHVAHGAYIGNNCMIIANSMIAGSVKIGDNSWVAPSSSILNKVIIHANSFIGMGAVVIRDVDSEIVVGNPAKPLKK